MLERLQRLSNTYAGAVGKDPANARKTRNAAVDNEPALLQGLKTDEEFWQLMAAPPSLLDDFALTKHLLGWFRQTIELILLTLCLPSCLDDYHAHNSLD